MREEVPNVETVALKTNYRSQQQILDTAVALLEQDPNRYTELIPLASHIPEDELGHALELPSPKLLRFAHDTSENLWIAQQIQKMHNKEKIPIEHIVVLARSSFAVKGLMNQLKQHNLNPILVGGTSILDTQAANLVLTIMRMLQFPQRNLFVWQLLRAYKLFLLPSGLKTAMDRAQTMPLMEVLENHQLWLSSKNSAKVQEFLDIYRRACAMLAANPTSLDTLLSTVEFVIDRIEYKKTIMNKFSLSSYSARMAEMDTLFEYIRSLNHVVESRLSADPTKTCLEVVLASTSFYNVTPQPGVSNVLI